MSKPDDTAGAGHRTRAVALRVFFAGTLSGTLVGLALGVFMSVLDIWSHWDSFNYGLWLPVFSANFFEFISACALHAAEVIYTLGLVGIFGGTFGGALASLLCRNVIRQHRLLLLAAGWAAPLALTTTVIAYGGAIGHTLLLATCGALSGATFGALLVPLFAVVDRGLKARRRLLGAVLGALYALDALLLVCAVFDWTPIFPMLVGAPGGALVGIVLVRRFGGSVSR